MNPFEQDERDIESTQVRQAKVAGIAAGYANILKEITDGAEVRCIGKTWSEVYAGDVTFTCKGWRFVLFNDCDSLDYTDSLTAPDGSCASFEDLFAAGHDPIVYHAEHVQLDYSKLVEQLRRARSDGDGH